MIHKYVSQGSLVTFTFAELLWLDFDIDLAKNDLGTHVIPCLDTYQYYQLRPVR